MYEKTTGPKYDANLTRTQIAANIREDLKAAQKSGQIPAGFKFSVRNAPRGRSIHLEVVGVPAGFQIQHAGVVRGDIIPQHTQHGRYTQAAAELLDVLEAIHGAYNYDRSEIESDYFDVNYYGSAEYSWRLMDAERIRIMGEQLGERLEIAPAPKTEPQVDFLAWAGVL